MPIPILVAAVNDCALVEDEGVSVEAAAALSLPLPVASVEGEVVLVGSEGC